MKPFYVERIVNNSIEWLLVDDWFYPAWNGCFCLVSDKNKWKGT